MYQSILVQPNNDFGYQMKSGRSFKRSSQIFLAHWFPKLLKKARISTRWHKRKMFQFARPKRTIRMVLFQPTCTRHFVYTVKRCYARKNMVSHRAFRIVKKYENRNDSLVQSDVLSHVVWIIENIIVYFLWASNRAWSLCSPLPFPPSAPQDGLSRRLRIMP